MQTEPEVQPSAREGVAVDALHVVCRQEFPQGLERTLAYVSLPRAQASHECAQTLGPESTAALGQSTRGERLPQPVFDRSWRLGRTFRVGRSACHGVGKTGVGKTGLGRWGSG